MFQRIRNLFQSFTRQPITKRGFLVCPKCRSSKVKQADSISGFITPSRYFCENCYYSGYFIVEVDGIKNNLEEFTRIVGEKAPDFTCGECQSKKKKEKRKKRWEY